MRNYIKVLSVLLVIAGCSNTNCYCYNNSYNNSYYRMNNVSNNMKQNKNQVLNNNLQQNDLEELRNIANNLNNNIKKIQKQMENTFGEIYIGSLKKASKNLINTLIYCYNTINTKDIRPIKEEYLKNCEQKVRNAVDACMGYAQKCFDKARELNDNKFKKAINYINYTSRALSKLANLVMRCSNNLRIQFFEFYNKLQAEKPLF